MPWPVPAPTLPLESFTSDPLASVGLLSPQVLGLYLVLDPLLGFLIAPQIPQSRLIPLPVVLTLFPKSQPSVQTLIGSYHRHPLGEAWMDPLSFPDLYMFPPQHV